MLQHVQLVCKVMLSGTPQEFVLPLTPPLGVPLEQPLLLQQLPAQLAPLVMLPSQEVANLAVQQLLLPQEQLLRHGWELLIVLFARVHPPLHLPHMVPQLVHLLKPMSHVHNVVLLML